MDYIFIFQILVILFSVVIHEVSHGYVAESLGDPTARLAGRLTLNPIKHIDLFGSIIVPLILVLIPGGIVFGWAKPVPYNPFNLKDPKKGGALIALAGPLSNFLIALVFAVFYRFFAGAPDLSGSFALLEPLIRWVVLINIVLGVFNLVPIPPLDGSKVLFGFLSSRFNNIQLALERYGMFILLFFIFFAIQIISPVIFFIFRLFVGL